MTIFKKHIMGLTPIARWDVVPWQRIEQSGTFNAGIVAFSKFGIRNVKISITDDGTNTESATITNMSLNDRTGAWEYWTTINCNTYKPGVVTLSATINGKDGGQRIMDDITLVADSSGDIDRPEAWVSVSGGSHVQGTAGIDDDTKPYSSIGYAAKQIQAWNNANGNGNTNTGGIIYLNSGNHDWAPPSHWDYDYIAGGQEWMTVTPASGLDYTNTKIVSINDVISVDMMRVKDVGGYTTNNLGIFRPGSAGIGSLLWLDGVVASGSDITSVAVSHENYEAAYYTDVNITNVHTAMNTLVNNRLMRNCDFSVLGRTAIYAIQFLVNCVVDDVNPYETNDHANSMSWSDVGGNTWYNRIVFGLKVTNTHYSGFALQRGANADGYLYNDRNIAFVNVDVQMVDPINRHEEIGAGGFFLLWSGKVDHFLWWHVTLRYTGVETLYTYVIRSNTDAGGRSSFKNSSWRANNFHTNHFQEDASKLLFINLEVDNNHFITNGTSQFAQNDAYKTAGVADMDANGIPTAGGNLVNRLNEVLVPIDLSGNLRSAHPDVGAYEYVS